MIDYDEANEGASACYAELVHSIKRNNDTVFASATALNEAVFEITRGLALGPLTGALTSLTAAMVVEQYQATETKLALSGMPLDELEKRREELAMAVGLLTTKMMKMTMTAMSNSKRHDLN